MRDAEARAAIGTPEEFAEECLPSANWPDGSRMTDGMPQIDVWKSRRASIAAMVRARDERMQELGYQQGFDPFGGA